MEEDIKILEEFTESSCCLASQEEIIECVKNLIKGYRDSENIMENAVKENLELKKYIRELEEQIDKHVYFETTNPKEIEKNYIAKSKIKEKIEEKCKAFRHRTRIEEVLECEFRRLEKELMEDK